MAETVGVDLWLERLSPMTMSSGSSVGTSNHSQKPRKLAVQLMNQIVHHTMADAETPGHRAIRHPARLIRRHNPLSQILRKCC